MTRALPTLALALLLAACGDKTPERPDEKANVRLDSMEARLDAAEAADPAVRSDPDEKGPDAAAPDPLSSDEAEGVD